MKIAACVVLYNPDIKCLDNINSYYSLVDCLYVLDNSDCYNSKLIELLTEKKNVEYINLGGNQGIAYALKVGLQKSVETQFDLCLTMDQDSIFPTISRTDLENKILKVDLEQYGIIGLNINSSDKEDEIVEVKYWLTSGNFIVLNNYKKIHGVREELFIDYVDFDLNQQFDQINKKVAYWRDLSLIHQIGNPKKYNFFGVKFTVLNHAPIRYYYRFRNARYLYLRNKKFFRKLYFHDLCIDIPKIILFEKQKRLKLRLIKKGRKDAKKGILGKYETN